MKVLAFQGGAMIVKGRDCSNPNLALELVFQLFKWLIHGALPTDIQRFVSEKECVVGTVGGSSLS